MRICSLIVAAALAAPAPAQTIFQFDGNLNRQTGTGTLEFRGASSGQVTFGTASGFGLPALPGGNAQVMQFPAFAQADGLLHKAGVGPNGGGAYVNQYTFGFDVLFPAINWHAFYNTEGANPDNNDADFYMNPTGGIGISGAYDGTVPANAWRRVMVTVDLTGTPTMRKYLNGTPVGTQTLGAGVDGRWSLYSLNDPATGTALFTEGDTSGVYTSAGFINSMLFDNRVYSDAEIASYGAPAAGGFTPVPEPSSWALAGLAVAAAAWRRRRAA